MGLATGSWNLEGCSDAAFIERAISWVEKEHGGLSKSVLALQEYAPGVVAMRDANRNFIVVFDPVRWREDSKLESPPAVLAGCSQSIRTVTFPDSRENFDDFFAHAKEAISPNRSGARWHTQRLTPILASS